MALKGTEARAPSNVGKKVRAASSVAPCLSGRTQSVPEMGNDANWMRSPLRAPHSSHPLQLQDSTDLARHQTLAQQDAVAPHHAEK